MKIKFCCALFLAAAFVRGLPAPAQDALKVAPDHYKILLENEHVRVIENTLAPGEKDAMHTHPSGWYYVTKPGTMKVVHADGKMETWEAKAGEAGWLKTEGPHTSENIGKTTMSFVLVEVKSAAKNSIPKAPKAKPAKAGRQINPGPARVAAAGSGGTL
ncbi:MAG: hypothetical protein LAO78_04945 [Acidobacteriia bacterium]|nr:hypothetical protein [Terriglobia bacterium]